MSGGSLNYVYGKVDDAADYIGSARPENPLYSAFAKHLKLVSEALHNCEWVFSCDYGEGDADAAIKAVLGDSSNQRQLEVILADFKAMNERLGKLLNNEAGNSR